MKLGLGTMAVGLAIVLGGCATPQANVALKGDGLGASAGTIGVVMSRVGKPDTYFPGANCLLCVATANLAHTTLTKHTQSLSSEDLSTLKQDVAATLKARGVQAVVLPDPLDIASLPDAKNSGPNVAKKDFTAFGATHKLDKLLVIQMFAIGYTRNYAAYIPTGDPKAISSGLGYIVDIKTNMYDWYMPFTVLKSAEGSWDEPPKFPGLTNAYFQAIESTRDQLTQALGRTP